MPAFELSLLLKVLPRADLSSCLKRVGNLLLDKGIALQKIENLGVRDLPYRIVNEGVSFQKANYFVYSFTARGKIFDEITDECSRDLDIIRHNILHIMAELPYDCTLDEELKPPALRKSVLNLMAQSKKNKAKTTIVYKYVKEHNFKHPYS